VSEQSEGTRSSSFLLLDLSTGGTMVREEEAEVLQAFPCPFAHIKIYKSSVVGVSPLEQEKYLCSLSK